MAFSCRSKFASLIILILLAVGAASAQTFPTRPIRIVLGTAGGGDDATARIIAAGIAGPLGQPVIVDNRGSGIIAAELVSRAPSDGYTLHLNGSAFWNNPLLREVRYAVADFAPISLIQRDVFVLAVHPTVPVKSVRELLDMAKARPGQLNYSSGAAGASAHLAFELFKSMAGINIVRIAYKGGSPAVTGLVAGEVQTSIFDAILIMPLAKAGKLRALAVTTAQPTPLVAGLPTVSESGVPGYEAGGLLGIYAPDKTPAAVINRLNQEIVRVLTQAEAKEKFFNAGVEVVASSPEEFAAIIKSETAKIAKVIKDAGIKID